jgi:dephospho-CoA kinase
MLIIGLTGNYGMGKSSVASMFRELGAATIDSDEIVAGLLKNRGVIRSVAGIIGKEALNRDKTLNKRLIAEKIFTYKKLRIKLEAFLHPLVFEVIEAFVRKIRDRDAIIIVEIPLLFEAKFKKRFDRTITVHSSRKTALARLKKAGISRPAALARLNAQMDIREKKRLADYTIANNGAWQLTEARVRQVFEMLMEENRAGISRGLRRP